MSVAHQMNSLIDFSYGRPQHAKRAVDAVSGHLKSPIKLAINRKQIQSISSWDNIVEYHLNHTFDTY